MKVLFVWPNKDSFGFKPLSISLLSGIARNLGWQVRLFDTTEIDFGFTDNTCSGENAKIFKPVDLIKYGLVKKKINLASKFKKNLEEFKPDCLAVSVLSDEFLIAARISKIAKELNPNLTVIWGGKYPTLNPEKTLASHYVDFACVGEGISAFNDFLAAFSKNKDLCHIPNIWAKKDGVIVKNNIRPLEKSLDTLPYLDWRIFEKRQFYKPFDGRIYTSGDHMLNWGCPYHCAYCINHFYHELYDNKYILRRYSVKRIIDELVYLKNKYSLEFFKFHDEDFLMRPLDNFKELSEEYSRRVNLPFTIETNSRSVTKQKVELLKKMNCASVSIAIETGDYKLRKNLLKRKDSKTDILKAFSLFRDHEIRTSSFNMLGIPYESRTTYEKTISLNRQAQPQYPNIGFFYPFEGTQLREVAINLGILNPMNNDKSVYQREESALRFNNITRQELIEMRKVFVLYVKLPKRYWPFIKLSEQQDESAKKLRRKIIEIYDKTVWANGGWYKDDGLQRAYLNELEYIAQNEGKPISV